MQTPAASAAGSAVRSSAARKRQGMYFSGYVLKHIPAAYVPWFRSWRAYFRYDFRTDFERRWVPTAIIASVFLLCKWQNVGDVIGFSFTEDPNNYFGTSGIPGAHFFASKKLNAKQEREEKLQLQFESTPSRLSQATDGHGN
jgi:hypothetical protein